MDLGSYILKEEPCHTTYNTVFRLYYEGENYLLLKLAYSKYEPDEVSTFLYEAAASKIAHRLKLDFIKGIDHVVKLTDTDIKTHLHYDVPPGEYQAAIIHPVRNCTSLHELGDQVFEEPYVDAFWDFIEKLIHAGKTYGFVHSDLHTSNILYDFDAEEFVLIDLGRSVFSRDCGILSSSELSDLWNFLIGGGGPKMGPGVMRSLGDYYDLCPVDEFIRRQDIPMLIMFDIVGLLYYLKHFTVPDNVFSIFKRMKYFKMDTEMLCLRWFYGMVVATSNNLRVENKWYLYAPLDLKGFITMMDENGFSI